MKIIKIGAVWCPGCLVMRSRWQKIEHLLCHAEINEYDLDMDQDKIKYEIGKILPICILEKDGKEVDRFVGEKTEKELLEIIEKWGINK